MRWTLNLDLKKLNSHDLLELIYIIKKYIKHNHETFQFFTKFFDFIHSKANQNQLKEFFNKFSLQKIIANIENIIQFYQKCINNNSSNTARHKY